MADPQPQPDAAQVLRWARAQERRGNLESAVKGYVQVKASQDAARVYMALGRFVEAGDQLLHSIGYDKEKARTLDATRRRIAVKAANCLVLGEDLPRALDLLLAMGERQRAVELLRRRGDHARANRLESHEEGTPESGIVVAVAREESGMHRASRSAVMDEEERDADRFIRARHAFEAAICFIEDRDLRRALRQLEQIPRDHERYRDACVLAVRGAIELDALDPALEPFAAHFVAAGAGDGRELETLYDLAGLYERQGRPADAADCYRKVLARSPEHRDAAQKLSVLEGSRKLGLMQTMAMSSQPSTPALGVPVPAAFTPGSVVNGRYRLERKIGQGGTAVIYEAFDLELEEPLAIKFFSTAWADEAMVGRFKQEMSLSRRFHHPNVIRLHDIGTHADYKYISMELLDGESLGSLMRAKAVGPAAGRDYLKQACAALQCVHDAGVIHRDIKPDNFFVTRDGVLKVMDFGIAKRYRASRGLTAAGMMAGTPQYMAPEQINDFANVTHLADIYSLGCIAYELFTGAPPFQHPEVRPILVMHLSDAPEPPRTRNPALPEALDALILRLLSKDPAARVASCSEVAGLLGEIRI